MSFDLFVSPFDPWHDAERQKIMEILCRDATSTVGELYSVRYADGGALEISGLEDWGNGETNRHGLGFSRFGGQTFMSRLYEIADRLDAMVYWPGDPPFFAVTRQDLFDRRPPELKPGDAVIVRDAEHLVQCIES